MAEGQPPTGDELLRALAALANPHRLRIVGALVEGRNYVSRLAREIGMSRPLLHMHLQRLEAAGLIVGSLELSSGGKATRYFEVAPFVYELTPESVADAVRTLSDDADRKSAEPPERPRAARQKPGARKTGKNPEPAEPAETPAPSDTDTETETETENPEKEDAL